MKKLPVYKAVVNDDDESAMFAVSLVDFPAVEKDFLAFSKDVKTLNFSIENEEKHLVTGLVMSCDTPIYRIANNGMEYYIVFDAETIKNMTRKFLKSGFNNNVDLNHDFNYIEGVELLELYIKDTERGIDPKGFEDVKNGSLFGTYFISDEKVWEEIKAGTYKGFSIEISCGIEKLENNNEKRTNNVMSKINKLKAVLSKMLETIDFGEVSTDKGMVRWSSENELPEIGESVVGVDEDGNELQLEDGDYALDGGIVIVIKDHRVEEVRKPEPEEEKPAEPEEEKPVEEPMAEEEEEKPAEDETPADPEPEEEEKPEEEKCPMEERVIALEELVAKLEARIAELEKAPAADSATEEFKRVNSLKTTGDAKLDKLNKILNS